MTPAKACAATGEIYERDGSKIEGVNIFWLTEDSYTNAEGRTVPQEERNDKAHLFLSSTSEWPLDMKFQVEVQFSGQYDYDPGDITITIPAKIWRTRELVDDGNGSKQGVVSDKLMGSMDLSVPRAPSAAGDFNWQLIDGNYVLTNTKTIGATSDFMFQATVKDISPRDVVDMSESLPLSAHVEVVTNQGNIISRTSNEINAQIDTIAEIKDAKKSGDLYTDYGEVKDIIPASLLQNLPAGTDPADYIYVRWYTYLSHKNSQPFTPDPEDSLSDAYVTKGDGTKQIVTRGIMLGTEKYEADPAWPGTAIPEVWDTADVDFAARIMENKYHSTIRDEYDHVVYLWSAYKKDDMPPTSEKEAAAVVYQLENETAWILTETDAAMLSAAGLKRKHVR